MSQESDRQSEMRPEYDIRGGVRGKYFERYRQGTSVTIEDSPLITKGRASASDLGHVVWSVSYQSPNPSPTMQVGRPAPAESNR
jgi:hypothetical protein